MTTSARDMTTSARDMTTSAGDITTEHDLGTAVQRIADRATVGKSVLRTTKV
jgi:hypothetical protein